MKPATHLHLVLKLRMHGAIPPFPYFCMAWCLVKPKGNFASPLKQCYTTFLKQFDVEWLFHY
jgi:hypothetical protein